MKWEKVNIINDNGQTVEAVAPVIISASRATDIPAFYSDWFFNRLEKGHSAWTNPFNGVRSYVSYQNVRCIVFWTKNPAPLLPHLATLRDKDINCYVHFTINDHEDDGLELNVPPLAERIETFRKLSSTLGPDAVIWRYSPMMLTDRITMDELMRRIENIGNQLKGYTRKLVFGYADISTYAKVARNLNAARIDYREFTDADKRLAAERLAELNKAWGYELALCSDDTPVSDLGIVRNRCVDDMLMAKLFGHDKVLMDFLGIREDGADMFTGEQRFIRARSNKDTGQRKVCGCVFSKDIGQYNTCPHKCEYCYANSSKEAAVRNMSINREQGFPESIAEL